MADDLYGYDDEHDEPKGRDNLFLWTVFILILCGVAFACWIGSYYIFGHPEHPRSYRFLKKIGKIEAPQRFEVTAAPLGKFLTAQQLFEKYARLTPLELAEENAQLIRGYMKNYRESKNPLTYVIGRFIILDSQELKKSDMFPTGVVALAQAAENPQIIIEHVYTSAPKSVPALRSMLQTGLEMKIRRTEDLCSLVHVERNPDGRMQFTVLPLAYGSYALMKGVGTFSLEPPPELNMDPGLPVVKLQGLQDAVKKFAEYRRTHPVASAEGQADGEAVPTGPELVRVDTVMPGSGVPATGAMPPVPIATPIPMGKATPRIAAATPAATPPLAVAMLNTPAPRNVATPMPIATPLPNVTPSGVPLKPFIAAQRDPSMPTGAGSWRTYAPGKAPAAKSVTPSQAGELADRGELGGRIYLQGEFRVTASDTSHAVLREREPGPTPARIIAEFPAGAIPPADNSTFVRDAARPFEIRDVRRGADGQLNIYVREIIQQ